jgi:hypothetical protein
VRATPRPLYPRKEIALYRRLDGPQGRSGRRRKIPPPQGFILFSFCTLSVLFVLIVLAFAFCPLLYNTHTQHTSMPQAEIFFVLCTLSLLLCPHCPDFAFCPLLTKHTQIKHPCPRRDSNPQSQQVIGRRPSP